MNDPAAGFYKLAELTIALAQQGRKLIRLNIGNTALDVPEEVVTAFVAAAKAVVSGYGPAAGIDELREQIAQRENCSREQIVVGPGSKFLIFALLSVLRRDDKELFVPSPHWPAYPLIAQQVGMPVQFIPTTLEECWELPNIDFSQAAALLLCNPLNPTSTCYMEAKLRALAEAAKKWNVPFILDEAYRDLSFSPLSPIEAIHIRSFSKEFNMEGFRLGYMVGPIDLVQEVTRFIQISTSCVSIPIQQAGVAALQARKPIIQRNSTIWKSRLSVLSEELRRFDFEFAEPQAAMYLFARHSRISDSFVYAKRLLESHGVAVAPGEAFGPYPNFVRISASANEAALREAATAMGAALDG